MLSAWFRGAPAETRRLMLEVLIRRFYQIRKLENLRTAEFQGHCVAMAEYDHEGKRVHLVSTDSTISEIAEAVKALRSPIAEFPADHDAVIDLYAWSPEPLDDPDLTVARLGAVLNEAGFGRPVRRIIFGLASRGNGVILGRTQYYTFRLTDEGYCEEKTYRGLHPMMSKRLELWRLHNFHIERLPSAEDIHFFRGVARENPKDERLFAIAEVRDLTPVRDASGRVASDEHTRCGM